MSYGRAFGVALASAALALGASGAAQATTPLNQGPAPGAILDLDGHLIPHDPQAPRTYSVDFVAGDASTAVTFAFRDDPNYIAFSNVALIDLTKPAGSLVANGDFTAGLSGWTYANDAGAGYSGSVDTDTADCGAFAACWYDGSLQAYDSLTQTVSTHVGDTYRLSFQTFEKSGFSVFSKLSTNGNVTDFGGNGVDILAYATAATPTAVSVPEPAAWATMLIGFGAIGASMRRRRAAAA